MREPRPGEAHLFGPGPGRHGSQGLADQLPGDRHRPEPVKSQPDGPPQAGLQPALDSPQPGFAAPGMLQDDAAESLVVEWEEAIKQSVRLQQSGPDV